MGLFGKKAAERCDPTRVLIVDDEAPIRDIFKMILTAALPNLTFDQACNGMEAVRLFREKHQGVITMDVRMPVLSGTDAFLAIQKSCEEENRQVPYVVFCTGFAPTDSVTTIVGQGDYHCLLLKPARSAEIVEAVKSRLKLLTPPS